MHLPSPLRLALFGLGVFLFHLLGSQALPLIDRDEPRFAEASREMLDRGDYIVPYFNNRERFDKPPLTYWCQVAAYRLLGETELAARAPSALAAALVAVLLVWIGPRFGASGWRAALIFSLCLQTMMHARAAVADMWLVLFTTIAFAAGWLLLRIDPTQRDTAWRYRAVFWVSLGLGFLAKGPIAWLPIGAVAILAWMEKPAGVHRRMQWIPGVILMMAIVAAWGVPALLKTHGEFWDIGMGKHVLRRTVRPMEGHGGQGWLGYLLSLPLPWLAALVSLFPWSIKLPRLIRDLGKSPRWESADRYLIAGTVLTFGVFTFSATKLPHYTLPAFPLIALLLDRHWPIGEQSARGFRRWALGTAVAMALMMVVVPSRVTWFFPTELLFREMKPYLRPEMEFASVDYQEPSLVWKFRGVVNGWHFSVKNAKAAAFMSKPGTRFCIVPTDAMAEIFPQVDPGWKVVSVEGFNIPKGKVVRLTGVVKGMGN